MRTSFAVLALTAAATVAAQSSIEEGKERYFFYFTNPAPCSSVGCQSDQPTCGAKDHTCGDKSCGTWGGMQNVCCNAVHYGDSTMDCGPWKDTLENANIKTVGTAAVTTDPNVMCTDQQNYILSIPDESGRNICCPVGTDSIIQLNYNDLRNNLTVVGARCIPPVGGTSASTTASPNGDKSDPPSVTGTSAAKSSPNAASRLQNVFALAPIALMALAGL
ncbi:hypothetical protein ABW21_db0201081 [Orbilia brochopaga]|nr:hypothetical protein ABW21_db0201081 [Drechslerella brochopaga]